MSTSESNCIPLSSGDNGRMELVGRTLAHQRSNEDGEILTLTRLSLQRVQPCLDLT